MSYLTTMKEFASSEWKRQNTETFESVGRYTKLLKTSIGDLRKFPVTAYVSYNGLPFTSAK